MYTTACIDVVLTTVGTPACVTTPTPSEVALMVTYTARPVPTVTAYDRFSKSRLPNPVTVSWPEVALMLKRFPGLLASVYVVWSV